jgi:Protein of unknown function (DUF2844)
MMKIGSFRARNLALAALLTGCFLASAALPARAGLGADASSIDSDAAAMRGNMSQPSKDELEQSTSYKVKTFVTESGTTVHEYSALSGAVFGVAWSGRRPPDLSVLLGSYYPEYVSAMSLKHHRDLHHTMIQSPRMVVVMGGHMGHLVGRAYAPGLAPSGVDPKAVVK